MFDALVFVLVYHELGFVLIDVLFLVLCLGTMLCPCRSNFLCPCRATFSAGKTTLSKMSFVMQHEPVESGGAMQ